MKNYQRGFMGLATLVVGTILIIGLGSWWYMHTNTNVGASDEEGTMAPTAAEADARAAADAIVGPASSGIIQTLDGGLVVEDVKVGNGAEAKVGQTLSMHYTGTLDNGAVFDSSIPRGQPFKFILGAGQVIAGWDRGIVGMKVGGKRKLTIPAELGYGNRDMGAIPPNSRLHFDVELLSVK